MIKSASPKGNAIKSVRRLPALLKAVGCTTILGVAAFANGQTWSDIYPLSGASAESIQLFEYTPSGNLFIGGTYSAPFSPGGENLPTFGEDDLYFGEWTEEGENLWISGAGSADDESLAGVINRQDGSFVLGGRFFDELQFPGGTITSSIGSDALFIVADNPDQDLLWSQLIEGNSTKDLQGLVPLSNGEIIAFGSFSGTLFFNQTLTFDAGINTNGFIAKYSADGQFLEARELPAQGFASIDAATVDAEDNLYLLGSFDMLIQIGTENLITETQDLDLFVARYDSDTFSPVWSQHLGAQYDEIAVGIQQQDDELLLAGYFFGVLNFKEGDLEDITTPGFNYNGFLARLDKIGTPLQLAGFGQEGDEFIRDFDLHDGKPVYAGYYVGDPQFEGQNLPASGAFKLYAYAGSWDGTNWGWATAIPTANRTFAERLTMAPNGDVWVAGTFQQNAYFNGMEFTDSGISDAFFGRLSPNFTPSVDIEKSKFKLFPNPVSDWLIVEGLCAHAEIEIYDQWARKMPPSNATIDGVINTASLPAGMYFLRIRSCGESMLLRFIKH
ncbi:MAG: T9SS type A sorting domain-containing protein [Bacteroidetes bacterium]|nr:T9SS type A sorting domain-containing protein [Bacteroidota bacterium]